MNALRRLSLTIFLTVTTFSSLTAHAAPVYNVKGPTPPLFATDLPKEPTRPRGVILAPILSFMLPGIDQWYEAQYKSAAFYTGTAVVGLNVASIGLKNLNDRNSKADSSDIGSRDNDVRLTMLGLQMYMAAGSLSAYESFRSAVRTQQPLGQYTFLKKEETTGHILLAPFSFSMLKRPSTYIPIGLILAGASIAISQEGGLGAASYTGADAGFAGGFSYLAGTNEEAVFRGWMMPVFMEWWDSRFWSNTASATVFAALHMSSRNQIPWPQFALGWYLGYLTQKNDWTLEESIFIHTWWDVVAFSASYIYESQRDRKTARLYLPLINARF